MRVPAPGGGPGSVAPSLPSLPRGGRRAEASAGILQSSCGLLGAGRAPSAVRPALFTSRVSAPLRRRFTPPTWTGRETEAHRWGRRAGIGSRARVPPRSPASCFSWRPVPSGVRVMGRMNTGLELSGSLPVVDLSETQFWPLFPGATRPRAVILSSEAGTALSAGSGPGCGV